MQESRIILEPELPNIKLESVIALDIETTSLDIFNNHLLLLQIYSGNTAYVINCTKTDIKPLIEQIINKNILVIGHNIKFDINVIRRFTGLKILNVYDSMIAESLMYRGINDTFYSLESLVEKYIGVKLDKSSISNFIDLDISNGFEVTEEMVNYAVNDIKYLHEIREKQIDIIKNIVKQESILDLEMKLIPVIADMEYNGIYFDVSLFKEIEETIHRKLEESKKELINIIISHIKNNYKQETIDEIFSTLKITGKIKIKPKPGSDEFFEYLSNSINLNSHQQIKAILYYIDCPVKNTDKRELKNYDHPVVKSLLNYREYSQLKDSFTISLLDKINPFTNRIHTRFNQLGTRTGRFSSSNPNLQQIPAEDYFRKAFKPEKGYKFVCADFSQQELRIMASVTEEPKLIQAYKDNLDIHTFTASLVLNKDYNEITSKERQIGKSLNFAIIYGSTEYGISFNFNIDIKEARKILKRFWEAYDVAYKFVERVSSLIMRHGYSKTPLGRKRYFNIPKIYSDEFDFIQLSSSTKRAGFNHIIQGCGADIIKLSLIRVFYDNPFGEDLKLVLTVHDEIVCEVKEEIAEQAKEFIVKCMKEEEQRFLNGIEAEVTAEITDYWSKS